MGLFVIHVDVLNREEGNVDMSSTQHLGKMMAGCAVIAGSLFHVISQTTLE